MVDGVFPAAAREAMPGPGKLAGRADRRCRLAGMVRLVASLIVLSCVVACSKSDPFLLPERTPVILVIVDTLRADRLGAYGYELETSPFLDRFAEQAYVFENNTTQCNSTLPSMTSTLSGLYTKTHRNYVSVPVPGLVRANDDRRFLQERLGAAGYHTLAVFSHPSWTDRTPIAAARGWDRLSFIPDDAPGDRLLLGHGEFTNARLFPLLEEWQRDAGSQPLFCWAHYFDPHTDLDHNMYNAPPAVRNVFLRHHLAAVGLEEHHDAVAPLEPLERHAWVTRQDPKVAQQAALAIWRSMYDAEILSFDAELERFFTQLEERGLWDDALIVVMADHGENMQGMSKNKGQIAFSHKRVFEGVAATPLMIRLPGQTQGVRIDAMTQNIDVLPTILELLGLDAEADVEGKSLVPLLRDPGSRLHDVVFIESVDQVERAVKTDELKYIDRGKGLDPLVYRWREDPGERFNVASKLPRSSLDTFAELLADFKPKQALRVRLVPGAEPYDVELELEVATTVIEEVIGAPGHRRSPDLKRFTWSGTVEDEEREIFLTLDRRNSRTEWSIRHSAREDLEGVVFLGQFEVARSPAIPLWTPAEGAPPEAPTFRVTRDEEAHTHTLEFRADAPRRFEFDARYAAPSLEKSVTFVSGEGFDSIENLKRIVFRGRASDERERAVCTLEHSELDPELTLLPRISGRWPRTEDVDWFGAPVRMEGLRFVTPHPLDPRITTLLLAGPPPEPPPGSILIWLETGGAGETEIDTSNLSDEEIQALRRLGYVK